MNHHQVLEISPGVTKEEIRKAYLRLVLLHHPDKTGGDDTRFKQINYAYEVLYNGYWTSEQSNENAYSFDSYMRRYRSDRYRSLIDSLIEEIKGTLGDNIHVSQVSFLFRIMTDVAKLATGVDSDCCNRLLALLNHLQTLPIKGLSVDDFDDIGYLISGRFKNSGFLTEYTIREYLPSMDYRASLHPAFVPFLNRLESLRPRRDISDISSVDWVCHERSSKWSYMKKVWKVVRANDRKLIGWADQYGFTFPLDQKLDRSTRDRLINILICYELS